VARDDWTVLERLRICEIDWVDCELPNKLVSVERWWSFADAQRISVRPSIAARNDVVTLVSRARQKNGGERVLSVATRVTRRIIFLAAEEWGEGIGLSGNIGAPLHHPP
jgi:hypothetical protein